ncbi:MAG: putative diverged CheY-domain [Proteobacteria bacterium]|nr:putative diverged CheY-domain [Pseudomonadota bacterium]
MTVLIVGGDKVDSFTRTLESAGFHSFRHWNGRKAGDHHQAIPRDTQLIVLVVDQVNHGMAAKVRGEAYALGLPIIYSPRSRARLDQQLSRLRTHALAA